ARAFGRGSGLVLEGSALCQDVHSGGAGGQGARGPVWLEGHGDRWKRGVRDQAGVEAALPELLEVAGRSLGLPERLDDVVAGLLRRVRERRQELVSRAPAVQRRDQRLDDRDG